MFRLASSFAGSAEPSMDSRLFPVKLSSTKFSIAEITLPRCVACVCACVWGGRNVRYNHTRAWVCSTGICVSLCVRAHVRTHACTRSSSMPARRTFLSTIAICLKWPVVYVIAWRGYWANIRLQPLPHR